MQSLNNKQTIGTMKIHWQKEKNIELVEAQIKIAIKEPQIGG